MRLTEVALDTAKEVDGVWCQHPMFREWRFKTARQWNPAFREFFRDRVRSTIGQAPDGSLTADQEEEITYEATVRYCFLDWDGPLAADDTPIEWTADYGLSLFRDRSYGHLFQWWSQRASDIANFLRRGEDAEVGKSGPSSSGSEETGSGASS